MRKLVVLFILANLIAALFVSTAAAQVTYSSGFQVANLSSTDEANIVITYYPQGTGSAVPVTDTIPAGGSVTYATIHTAAGDPFNGSVVVSSDQPVAAIANTLGNGASYGAATGGFSAGSTSFSLPLVMCNNNGFDTWFNIQNAGSSTANVTINYIPGLSGTADSDTATIEPGRALTFDQKSGSSGTEAKCDAGLGTTFVGAATITSDQPIVATVMQISETGFNVLMGYNGFTGGSDDVRAPLIMQANSGFYTGIQVQNAGTVSTTVTIDYAADTSGTGTVLADDVFTLDPGEANTILHSGTETYIGAATVTSDNGEPLVAIVNQVLPTGPYGTAYEAFAASDATSNVNVPLVMANNSQYYTGIQAQNVGSSDVTVTISYGPNGSGTFAPADEVFTLTPGASETRIQNSVGVVNDWTGQTYVGSASVTATGPIVVIVNEFAPFAGMDQFYTFAAFNY
jgi:hypothetical protein